MKQEPFHMPLFIQRFFNWFRYGRIKEWMFEVPGYPKRCFVCGRWFWLQDGHKYWCEAEMNPMCSSDCQAKYAKLLSDQMDVPI